jgi:hypothetical protein
MTTIINGSSPSITFSDSTTQSTAGVPLTGGNITGDFNVSGNVGVGTTSPSYKLDAVVTGNSINSIVAARNTTSGTSAGSQILVGNDSSNDLLVLRALSSTYTSSGVNTANGALIRAGGAGGMTLASTDGSGIINFTTGGTTERMRIDSSGNLYVLGIYNNPTSGGGNVRVQSNGLLQRDTSSLKYKNSIENATHGLNEVLALRPVTYKSNTDGDKVFGGLIAEEVDAAGLTEFVQYGEDGSPDALSYGNMVSLAFKAIQELNAKVDAQALEIAELKAKP